MARAGNAASGRRPSAIWSGAILRLVVALGLSGLLWLLILGWALA